ncbi:MAG: hypothetical protein PVI01_01905 [Gemmatimonadales bacterium]|jgi:hypothetical protein
MIVRAFLALVLYQVATVPTLAAQEEERPCPNLYPHPRIGEFAELQFTNAADESMLIRLAVVGSESVDGKQDYWIEVISAPPVIGDNVIVQMLVPHYPFENQDLEAYIVKMPGAPAQKVPEDLLAQIGEQTQTGPSWRRLCDSAEDLGSERVTVEAGTFETRHYRAGENKEDEFWVADVPFGMVKLIQADSHMELVRYGSDAKSSIKEKPLEMQQPPPNP